MLTITVRNFRGIADAVVQVAPIALVMGRNRVGKSSLCQAVGAALSGSHSPAQRRSLRVHCSRHIGGVRLPARHRALSS